MRVVLKGNDAVAHAVRLARPQLISAYPITPQTSIIEDLAEMVAKGELRARFLKVESEHSALAACIAAAATGVRTFTATSSHGLALMHELLHWTAGARLPVVMAEVNRALGPGWSIWADQTDSLSQRDTGWMQVYCRSAQEVCDSILQAYAVSERVLLPTMVVLDAFFLSHTYEDLDAPDQTQADAFLPPIELPHKLDVRRPFSLGNLLAPENYMEFRHKIHLAHRQALGAWEEAGAEWGRITGRHYGLVEEYRTGGARLVLVTSSTPASTARPVIDSLRSSGIPAGLLRLRVFRPFPVEEVCRVLEGKKTVVVLDRNCSFGIHGIFHQEIQSALYSLPQHERPEVKGVIAGLGGRDITSGDIEEILVKAGTGDLAEPVTWWKTLPEQRRCDVAPALQ